MKESDVDMDSTQDLLDSTLPDLPDTPDFVDSVIQDSEEDEIFFGNKSTKEKKGTYAKCTRRDTICLTDVDTKKRRSFNVSGRTKARDALMSTQPASRARESSSRSSLYSQENSIMEEEDEDDCVFAVPYIQVEEVTSTVFDECEEIEFGVGGGKDDQDEVVAQKEEINLSLNITGRKYRNKKYRNNLESIVSLPSATKVKELVEGDISLEGERRSHMDYGLELRDEVYNEERSDDMKESQTRLHSDQSRSSYSSEDSSAPSESVSVGDEVRTEVESGGVGACPGLEESLVSDCYSADISYGSDMVGDESSGNGEVFDEPTADEMNEVSEDQVDICKEMSELSSIGFVSSIEVSGIEPLNQTDVYEDVPHDDIAPVQSTFNDETATSDISYANSTANSGVVTFKNDSSVSGVYDSFSDDTQDEFLHDTEVQENTDGGVSVIESTTNESLSDEEDKFAGVKRNIFEGESDMESFVLGSVASELDFVADAAFALGSVVSNLDSVSGFVLGSVVSELGSVVGAGHVVETGSEVSLNDGDDSVFTRNSLEGNSTLNHSFEVPGEDLNDTETDTVENSSVDGLEVDNLDDGPSVEALHDQSEEFDENMEVNEIPQILLTRPSLSLPSNISSFEERSPSPDFLPASPDVSARSIYHTAPTSQNVTDLSPMFDTTAEEMMLFEMYGESYDEKVEALSKEEKLMLKDRLANRGEEEINLVAEKLHKIMQEKARESSIGSTISPFSLASSTPSFHIPSEPSPLNHTTPVPVSGSPLPTPVYIIPTKLTSPVQCVPEVHEFRVPPPSVRYPTDVTYHLPTSASLGKMVSITPSPKKQVSTPWMPPSPSPKFSSVQIVSPARSATSSRPPLSKIPQPVYNTPQRVLQTLNTPQRVTSTTPNSAKKSSRVADMKAAAYAAVASPVAEYVKSNPAPKLVQNVKAKDAQRDLESTLVEVEDKENMENRLSLLPPCPLPPAVYKSGALSEEQMIDVTGPEYAYIPEAYGTISSSAKVTKHVARVRVGAPQPGLKWNESCLVNDESLNSSPSVAKYKAPVKSVLKQTRRDSGLFDESMLEMSVHETKVVRKMARGRGRAKK